MYYFNDKYKPIFHPEKALDVDDLFFRSANIEEANKRAELAFDEWLKMDEAKELTQGEKEKKFDQFLESSLNILLLCKKLQGGKEEILC